MSNSSFDIQSGAKRSLHFSPGTVLSTDLSASLCTPYRCVEIAKQFPFKNSQRYQYQFPFQQQQQQQQHPIMPLSVTPMLHARTSDNNKKRQKSSNYSNFHRRARDARSCDNINNDNNQNSVSAYAKVSLEKLRQQTSMSRSFHPYQASVPGGSAASFYHHQHHHHPQASPYATAAASFTNRMSPKCHRVKPSATFASSSGLQQPVRLTDSFDQVFRQQITPNRRVNVYGRTTGVSNANNTNRHSRASVSSFTSSLQPAPTPAQPATNDDNGIYERIPADEQEVVTRFNDCDDDEDEEDEDFVDDDVDDSSDSQGIKSSLSDEDYKPRNLTNNFIPNNNSQTMICDRE